MTKYMNIGVTRHRFIAKKNIFLIVFLALIMTTFGFSKVAAAVERSCKAAYLIDQNGEKITVGGDQGTPYNWHFSVSGTGTTANQARKQARRNAHECMETQWDTRRNKKRPEACSTGNRVTHYVVNDIKRHIERRACEKWENRPLSIDIYRKTWGKTRCDITTQLNDPSKPDKYFISKDQCKVVGID